jgi:multiple sugar transport system permease protein
MIANEAPVQSETSIETVSQMERVTPSRKAETRRLLDYRTQGQLIAYLFLLPSLVIFAALNWYPMIVTVINSFQKVKLNGTFTWVGLKNYERMWGNPVFSTAWQNVAVYAVLSILMGYMVPIILAIMMNELRGALATFFRGVLYLPTLIPIAIALLVWRQIYAPDGGIINTILGMAGIKPILFLQTAILAKPAIIIIMTWLGAGSTVLIYLAALQEIPIEIYEAAEIDGFSPLQRIWYLTFPLISGRMQIMLVLQIIAVAQVFTEPFVLTAGGPANSTTTPVLEIYNTAFARNDFGLAAAWSVSMLLILSVFSVMFVWLRSRNQKV